MPVKTSTFVCPHLGAKWKTRMKTNTITEPTYARKAASTKNIYVIKELQRISMHYYEKKVHSNLVE